MRLDGFARLLWTRPYDLRVAFTHNPFRFLLVNGVPRSVVFEGRPGGPNFYIQMDPTLHDTVFSAVQEEEEVASHHSSDAPHDGGVSHGGGVGNTALAADHHAEAEDGHDSYDDDDATDDSPHHPYDHHGHYHGEACFGLVVEGRDVLSGFVKLARDTQRQQAVGIASVRLLPTRE